MPEQQTGNEFIDNLLASTPPQAVQPKRGANYNYPERLFMKPDGSVVSLQGDPQNMAYYQDKGYHLLSRAPGRDGKLSEVEQYRQIEYPKILADQQERAKIINALRRAADRDPTLYLVDEYDGWTVDDLRNYLQQIKEETGKTVQVVTPRKRPRAYKPDPVEAQLLAGVETAETKSIEGLQEMVSRSRGGKSG